MGFADGYFSKQKDFKPLFCDHPTPDLRYIVVIPAYREPDIITSLDSLFHCRKPASGIEIIVVFNQPENENADDAGHTLKLWEKTSEWIAERNLPAFRFLLSPVINLPLKDAGVGMARKTGMDQALYRFNLLDRRDGYIASFDADCTCDDNYFTEIERTIKENPGTNGFNLYFEHPLDGDQYPASIYRGIAEYEMHLRYLNLYTRFTGFPFAFHTIGSCFGVRADIYALQGGMNRKKAGEDFYFLHKVIPLGKFREINSTCVVPSPRQSGRVPFGTGAAMNKYVMAEKEALFTYAPECFHDLRIFFQSVGTFYRSDEKAIKHSFSELPVPLQIYLSDIKAIEAIQQINSNSASAKSFSNRFYRWFDAFRIIRYLNFAGREYHPKVKIRDAVIQYLTEIMNVSVNVPDRELLGILRNLERSRSLT